MNPGNMEMLAHNLKELKLSTMARELDTHLRQAGESQMDYEEFLLNLTDFELQVRKENRRKRRLKEAKFPLLKPLETFSQEAAPDLDGRLIRELASGDYIRGAKNVIFLGRSGTGKTHLATGLGMAACNQGMRVRFVTGCGLVNELVEAREEKTLSRIIKRYVNYDLLILDELGYVPFSKEGAELLFQILTERHERKSVIITTNLGFADWNQIFGDANLTSALLDRVTHRATIVNCIWDSFRLKDTLKNR